MTPQSTEKTRLGAMELLGVIGFSLFLGWFICVFFWFFTYAPESIPLFQRLMAQWLLFVGMALGNVLNRFVVARYIKIQAVKPLIIICVLISLITPLLMFISNYGYIAPHWLFCVSCALTGYASSHLLVSWLDFCGKSRVRNYMVFTSLSFTGASLLFIFCYLTPQQIQSLVSISFLILSAVMWFFMDLRSEDENEELELKSTKLFSSPRELEPLFFIFGATFGIVFVIMFGLGQDVVVVGLFSFLIGAVAITIVSLLNLKFSIVTLLRVLVVILVADCLVLPFFGGVILTVCIAVAAALWVVLTAVNYANIIKQIKERKLKVLFHVSAGLIPLSCGIAVGWLLAAILIAIGLSSFILTILMLGLAFLLVLVSMIFYPAQSHHATDAPVEAGKMVQKPVSGQASGTQPVGTDEQLLQAKCEAVARQFMLSPREFDVLSYLVRGRNADYICTKLVVSPHTAKSHIASIYRKVGIHNQQRLMVFVEDFELDESNLSHSENAPKN